MNHIYEKYVQFIRKEKTITNCHCDASKAYAQILAGKKMREHNVSEQFVMGNLHKSIYITKRSL